MDNHRHASHLVHKDVLFADDFEQLSECAERIDAGRVALVERVRVRLQVVVVLLLHNLGYPVDGTGGGR